MQNQFLMRVEDVRPGHTDDVMQHVMSRIQTETIVVSQTVHTNSSAHVVCVNTPIDNSGFQDIVLFAALRCVLLTRPVRSGRQPIVQMERSFELEFESTYI